MKTLIENIIKNKSHSYGCTDEFVHPMSRKNTIHIFNSLNNELVGYIDSIDELKGEINSIINDHIVYTKYTLSNNADRLSMIKNVLERETFGIKVIEINCDELGELILSNITDGKDEFDKDIYKLKLSDELKLKILDYISKNTSYSIEHIQLDNDPFYRFKYSAEKFNKIPVLRFKYNTPTADKYVDGIYKTILEFNELSKNQPYMATSSIKIEGPVIEYSNTLENILENILGNKQNK